jgi:hypothetical protein
MNKEDLSKLMSAGRNQVFCDKSGRFENCEKVAIKTIFSSNDGITKVRVAFVGDKRRGQEVVSISTLFALKADGTLIK